MDVGAKKRLFAMVVFLMMRVGQAGATEPASRDASRAITSSSLVGITNTGNLESGLSIRPSLNSP
jgi:hypothetical protein